MPNLENILTDRLALSQSEAARVLGVDRAKIAAAVRNGALALRRVPGGVAARITVTDLLAWFASWERKPAGRPRKKDVTNAD